MSTNEEQQLQKMEQTTPRERADNPGFSLNAKDLDQALKICQYLAKSKMVPKQFQGSPQDILVAISWGREVGMKPLQALNSIAVVNGTPSIYGPGMLALVRNSPAFEWMLEDNEGFAYARDNVKGWEHLNDIDPETISVCVVKRRDEPVLVRSFSDKDVQTAGLGNVHKVYPKLMRKYRARNTALKDAFPDVLKGMEIKEVVEEDEPIVSEAIESEDNGKPNVADHVKQKVNGNNEASEQKESEEVQEAEQVDEETGEVEDETEIDPDELTKDELVDHISSIGKMLYGEDWAEKATKYAEKASGEDKSSIDRLKKARQIEIFNHLRQKESEAAKKQLALDEE